MFLYLMALCVGVSIIIRFGYGIKKSKGAEILGCLVSLIICIIYIYIIICTNINIKSETGYETLNSLILFGTFTDTQSSYSLDGISLLFIGLTSLLTPIVILASEKKTEMISSILAVEGLLIGAFVTLDFITFYALFESTLIPMYFLIGISGSGTSLIKSETATRFFLYTLGGSILMLLALINLYIEKGSTNWYTLVLSTSNEHYINFLFIGIAFAVKIPMIPVHLWLPEAHTIAPTPGSMILAALLLKLGGYGILRWLIPIFPESFLYFQPAILTLSIISVLYGCGSCFRQVDIKRIIAYSSIVHMNNCIFAICSLSILALKAAVFEMISHGIISAGLFYLIGGLYRRYKTRTLAYYRGLSLSMPLFSTFFFLFILANSGLPLTSGFIGEIFMFAGSMSTIPKLTAIVSISMIGSGGYNIWLFNRLCFGSLTPYISKFKDLTLKETSLLSLTLVFTIFLGIAPNGIFYFLDNKVIYELFYLGV